MKLEEYKQLTNLTYAQLGKCFGVCAASVHHWIWKRCYPSIKNRENIKKKTKGKVNDFT